MVQPSLDALLHREGRVRPVWRIAVFLLIFSLLTAVGQYAISVLPRHPLEWGSLVVTTIAALAAGWMVLSNLDGRPFGALGFPLHRRIAHESLYGFAIGGGLVAIAGVTLLLTGTARFVPDDGSPASYGFFLLWSLLFFALAAAFEEAVFRGYPFQVLVEWLGVWPAVLLGSVLFSLLHGGNPNITPLALFNLFLAGVLLSLAYLRTRSLWFATGVHLGWNWIMAALFDFPVSGRAFDAPMYSGLPAGADWWTGGAFGPEAGIVGTAVLVVGTVVLWRAKRLAPAPEVTRLEPLVDLRLQPGSW
jgi:membrane protease YdiL (CAAX protease family)